MTKTVGKSRNDKKSHCGGTFPKTDKKKSAAINEPKECFSENDLCYGEDYDCDYDYEDEYEDEVDDDDEDDLDDDLDDGDEEGDSLDGQRNNSKNRHMHMNRLRGNRAATQGIRRELKMTGDSRRRRANRDKTTVKAAKTTGNKVQKTTAVNKVQETTAANMVQETTVANKVQETTAANKVQATVATVVPDQHELVTDQNVCVSPTGVMGNGGDRHGDGPNVSNEVRSDEHDAE